MSDSELVRRLASAAPGGPDPSLRGRVLAAVVSELVRPLPALDRFLARSRPWIAAAVVLGALGVGILVQERASSRMRAERRGPGPATDPSFERVVTELAGMGDVPEAAWIRGRFRAGTAAPVFGPRDVRRWLESAHGGDLR